MLTRSKKMKSSTLTENEYPSSSGQMSKIKANSWIKRADHPLKNDVVLKTLFEYLHFEELRSCRLVCKKWNESTLPFSRAIFQVNIMARRNKVAEEVKRDLVRFLELLETNTLGNPFAHYRLWAFNPKSAVGKQFINLCGKTAKGYIFHRDLHKIENLSKLLKLSPMLESLTLPRAMISKNGSGTLSRPKTVKLFPGPEDTRPKLTFLKSLNTNEVGNEWPQSCPTLYEELIGVAPNISTLNLHSSTFAQNKNSCEEVLECLEKLGRESSIESLKLPWIAEGIFEILARMVGKPNGLKLKHLDVLIHWQKPLLNEMMNLFKDSLISLRITNLSYRGCDQWFPPMPKLKRLELDAVDAQNSFLTHKNFSQTFPALEELKFTSSVRSENSNLFKDFINLDGEDSSVVKSLSVGDKPVKMETLNRILILFPILTKLECEIGELDGAEVLTQIWTHMTQLEELIIIGRLRKSLNLDSLVTGIPVPVIKQIRLSNYKIIDSLGQLDVEVRRSKLLMLVKEYRTLPSIGNLTNLKTLRLDLTRVTREFSGLKHLSYLTDVTGYFGFYSLKNIRNLHIVMCDFSNNCAEMLVKDKCLLTWKFNNAGRRSRHMFPPNLSHDDRNCVWIKASGVVYE